MRLNLNDNIKVKLTEHGKDIYYHQYDRTNAFLGRELCKPSYPKVDENGYTTFQLWCFMELYGVHMGMTLPNVIEPLDIVFDEPTIEPKRKTGKWEITEAYPHNVYCSECHKRYAQTHWEVWEDGSLPRKYCPNCGAKIEGAEPEDIPMEYFESGGR